MTARRRKATTTPQAEEAPVTHPITTETAEMTDAEAIETLVRTDEEHLTEAETPVQVLPGTTPGTEQAKTQGTNPQMFHVLSQIDDGVFVAWDFCRTCGKKIADCTDKGGPGEPKYVTAWRQEWIAKREKADAKALADLEKKIESKRYVGVKNEEGKVKFVEKDTDAPFGQASTSAATVAEGIDTATAAVTAATSEEETHDDA